MKIDNMNVGNSPVVNKEYNVGDTAFIIESNRFIREVTIVKKRNTFRTVRFADSHGAISIRTSRLYGARSEAEDTLPKKKTVNAGPCPPHRIW